MVASKRTVFLQPETSGDLAKRDNLECTHLMHAKLALFATGDLAAGCMVAGQGGPNLGKRSATWSFLSLLYSFVIIIQPACTRIADVRTSIF